MTRLFLKIKEYKLMKHFREERLKADQSTQKKGGHHG